MDELKKLMGASPLATGLAVGWGCILLYVLFRVFAD